MAIAAIECGPVQFEQVHNFCFLAPAHPERLRAGGSLTELMKILVIGGGAREHALAWKLQQSPKAEKIYVAPGNAGTRKVVQNVPIPASESEQLLQFARVWHTGLTVLGPGDALAVCNLDRLHS